jgi:very-long-chain (3R)-3-hydroxyacyl-CoA dehydratase
VLTGWVKTSLSTTLIQVASRFFLTFGICALIPERMQKPIEACFYTFMILAWTITEIVRYPYYLFSLLDKHTPSYWLWIRYTLFYVLYPMGAISEWILLGMAYIKGGTTLSQLHYDMPNTINMVFDYRHLILIVILTYFVGFPIQYRHMINQRAKYLQKKPPPPVVKPLRRTE